MDPRFLRTFVAVARLGSFSAAARELGYTQSGVSQHISVLEADLGTVLLTRRPVAPTEAGARLLEHAEPILLRLDAARADVARVVAGPPATLRIGTEPLGAGFGGRLGASPLAGVVGGCGAWAGVTRSLARSPWASSTRASSMASRRPATRCDCPRPARGWPPSRRSRWWSPHPSITRSAAMLYKWKYWSMPAGSMPQESVLRSPNSPCSPALKASGPR